MWGNSLSAGHARMSQPAAPAVDAAAPRVRLVGIGLKSLWRSGLATRPSFDPDALVAGATARTGLDDLGDPAIWRTQLDLLCEGLEGSAALNPLGRAIAIGQLRAILRDRLLVQALWRRHPGIADIPIAAPIVIVGQMRAGTTRMQRLLACDPALTATRFFESWNPVPLRPGLPWDDRRTRARLALGAIRGLNPEFSAIHPTGVDEPDEELGLNSHALFGSAFEAQWRIPRFARHCEHRDTKPVYAEFRRLLQTLRWLRRGDTRAGGPWVIKLPQMTQDMESVLAVFPDARLVVLDRPAEQLVASSANLVENQMRVQSDSVDNHWIGREWLGKIGLRRARVAAALKGFTGPRVDLDYDGVGRDWRTAVRRVYRALDLNLSPAAEAAMHAFVTRSERRPKPARPYRLERYGLTAADVGSAMRDA